MKKKSTRLSRWKAALCLAVVASASSMAHAQYAGPVISPTSLDFATVDVGTTSAVQTLTASIAYGGTVTGNSTNGNPFVINSIVLPAGYARSGGTCPNTGNATSPCTIGIVFAPTGVGPAAGNAAITATSNGLPGLTNVAFTGIGAAAAGPAQAIPMFGNLGLLLTLAGLGGVGVWFARRH